MSHFSSTCAARPQSTRLVRLAPDALQTSTRLLQSRCDQVWQGPSDPQKLVWFLQVVRAARFCADDRGCSRRAVYNFEGGSPLYCSDHKHADMVPPLRSLAKTNFGLRRCCTCCLTHTCVQVNTSSKRCQKEGCKTIPSFNFPGKRPAFCKEHALPGMVSHPQRVCWALCSTVFLEAPCLCIDMVPACRRTQEVRGAKNKAAGHSPLSTSLARGEWRSVRSMRYLAW